jgi:hypothetical protein
VLRRILLDQNFPKPPFLTETLQPNVRYEHLSDFAPELARQSTPDWLLYLAADQGGIDILVTRDRSQLEQSEELIALAQTKLSVVTWRRKIEDPVAEWGQLLAFVPQILRALDQHGPRILILPEPRIGGTAKASDLARKHAAGAGTSYPELRAEAIRFMVRYLGQQRRSDLEVYLRQ